jgi:hypothetical protein
MTELNSFKTRQLSAMQNVLALHQPRDRVAVLVELVFVYRAKNSAAELCLHGKKKLLRLEQDFPLTEAEANAVEDGVQPTNVGSN